MGIFVDRRSFGISSYVYDARFGTTRFDTRQCRRRGFAVFRASMFFKEVLEVILWRVHRRWQRNEDVIKTLRNAHPSIIEPYCLHFAGSFMCCLVLWEVRAKGYFRRRLLKFTFLFRPSWYPKTVRIQASVMESNFFSNYSLYTSSRLSTFPFGEYSSLLTRHVLSLQ